MSTNDFARPAWVIDVLTTAHGKALPQFTTRTFKFLSVNTATEKLMQNYTSAQTEHSRLRFLLERLEDKKSLLARNVKTTPDALSELEEGLGDEERKKLEEVEDYEEEIWSDRAKMGVWEGVRELHRSIEGLKERIREVEREVKKAEKGRG